MVTDENDAGDSEAAVGDAFITLSVLLVHEMLIGPEVDGFPAGIMFSENLI